MLKELVLKKITEIKNWEGSKGTPYYQVKYKRLKQELLDLIPDDMTYFETGDYVIHKSFNPTLGKFIAAIYTKESFKKRSEYLKRMAGGAEMTT